MPKNLNKLIIAIIICEFAGILGAFFTISAIPSWYVTLTKPSFSPPSFIFGPVWTILYLLMAVSLYLVWTKKKTPTVFWAQLLSNAIWSPLFFGLKSPLLGLIDIFLLWILIIWTIKIFYKINKWSAYLLIPYLLWVSFASILNYYIWILN